MRYHEAFPDLASLYLEDSWVLELTPQDDGLTFRLDAVLTSEHPLYAPPEPGEQYCYRKAWLSVRAAGAKVGLSGILPATDATGESDFGNVDSFAFNLKEDRWELDGDWGFVWARAPEVTLRFD